MCIDRHNQVVLVDPVVELVSVSDDCVYLDTALLGLSLRLADRDVRNVESGDVPAALCQHQCVSPLAHRDVYSLSGLLSLDDLYQERIGKKGLVSGCKPGVDIIPEFAL